MNLRDGNWDRQLEDWLPDSRLSGTDRERTAIQLGRLKFERIFCASCGANGGGVLADWSPHVFYVCQECADKLGPPPGMAQIENEAALRGQA